MHDVWYPCVVSVLLVCFFFFQAEDGIRDLVRSRGLGDVYKRQLRDPGRIPRARDRALARPGRLQGIAGDHRRQVTELSLIHI